MQRNCGALRYTTLSQRTVFLRLSLYAYDRLRLVQRLQKRDKRFVREALGSSFLPVRLVLRYLYFPVGFELQQSFSHVLSEVRSPVLHVRFNALDWDLAR